MTKLQALGTHVHIKTIWNHRRWPIPTTPANAAHNLATMHYVKTLGVRPRSNKNRADGREETIDDGLPIIEKYAIDDGEDARQR